MSAPTKSLNAWQRTTKWFGKKWFWVCLLNENVWGLLLPPVLVTCVSWWVSSGVLVKDGSLMISGLEFTEMVFPCSRCTDLTLTYFFIASVEVHRCPTVELNFRNGCYQLWCCRQLTTCSMKKHLEKTCVTIQGPILHVLCKGNRFTLNGGYCTAMKQVLLDILLCSTFKGMFCLILNCKNWIETVFKNSWQLDVLWFSLSSLVPAVFFFFSLMISKIQGERDFSDILYDYPVLQVTFVCYMATLAVSPISYTIMNSKLRASIGG